MRNRRPCGRAPAGPGPARRPRVGAPKQPQRIRHGIADIGQPRAGNGRGNVAANAAARARRQAATGRPPGGAPSRLLICGSLRSSIRRSPKLASRGWRHGGRHRRNTQVGGQRVPTRGQRIPAKSVVRLPWTMRQVVPRKDHVGIDRQDVVTLHACRNVRRPEKDLQRPSSSGMRKRHATRSRRIVVHRLCPRPRQMTVAELGWSRQPDHPDQCRLRAEQQAAIIVRV